MGVSLGWVGLFVSLDFFVRIGAFFIFFTGMLNKSSGLGNFLRRPSIQTCYRCKRSDGEEQKALATPYRQ